MNFVEIKTSELIGSALDYAVAVCEDNVPLNIYGNLIPEFIHKYSTDWEAGGPIIENNNITLIRANNEYKNSEPIPNWFAETDKWVGHGVTSSCNHEQFDPCFMIDEESGYYGTAPLIAAMRCYVACKLGNVVKIPQDLLA